jgi:osmotically-inducible protein OsmY
MSDEGGPDARAMSASDRALAARIDRRLRDEAGIYAAVRVGGGIAYLDGLVESVEQREAATDLALGFVGIDDVQNDLEVEEFGTPGVPARTAESTYAEVSYEMLEGDWSARPGPLDELAEPDLNEPVPLAGGDVTRDPLIAAEEGIPYVPPVDPVVRPSRDAQLIAIVGGFGTAADEAYPDFSATTALGEAPPGDDDLRERVVAALLADAATTDMAIDVTARDGVVHLRGAVPTLDDAALVEEVAGRVPGVSEVVEALAVVALG